MIINMVYLVFLFYCLLEGFIAPDKVGYPHYIFSYFFTKRYVVGTH